MTVLKRITNEIVDLHDFFTGWYNGTVSRDTLGPRLLSRLDDNFIIIPPEGHVLTGAMLKSGFEQSHGSNKDFRIQIRDVAVRHQFGTKVIATYTEWQIGARQSAEPANARLTSVLLDLGPPITWLHIHETWLPEDVRAAGHFNF